MRYTRSLVALSSPLCQAEPPRVFVGPVEEASLLAARASRRASRVLEVEVELLPPNDGAAATVLVLEQPGTTDATVVDATSCLDDEPSTTSGW